MSKHTNVDACLHCLYYKIICYKSNQVQVAQHPVRALSKIGQCKSYYNFNYNRIIVDQIHVGCAALCRLGNRLLVFTRRFAGVDRQILKKSFRVAKLRKVCDVGEVPAGSLCGKLPPRTIMVALSNVVILYLFCLYHADVNLRQTSYYYLSRNG